MNEEVKNSLATAIYDKMRALDPTSPEDIHEIENLKVATMELGLDFIYITSDIGADARKLPVSRL